MEQALKKRGLSQLKSKHHTRQLTSQMYQNLKNLMFDNRLHLYNDPPSGEEYSPYINELLELQAKHVSKYIIEVEAPNIEGKHDDMADAIVRMAWLATENANRKAIVTGGSRGSVMQPSSRFGSPVRRVRQGSHSSRIPNKNPRRW